MEMIDPEQLSDSEKNDLIRLLYEERKADRELIKSLQAQIDALKERLDKDSSNSHKPPSSDIARGKRSLGKRKPRKRKDKGSHRELLPPDQVDHIHDLKPPTCTGCLHALSGHDLSPQRHQISELPPIKPIVTEYRLHALECPCCGRRTRAVLPEDVSWTPFGPHLQAFVVMMIGLYRLSRRQVQALLTGWSCPVSLGAIHTIEQRASAALLRPVEDVAHFIRQSRVVNADETSWRENGRKIWLWAAANDQAAFFMIDDHRSRDAAEKLLGADFEGILISDRFNAYHWVDGQRRQFCWAHLKRDFQAMIDSRNPVAQIVGRDLLRYRKKLFRWWRRVRAGRMKRPQFKRLVDSALKEDVELALIVGSASGHKKYAGMCRRIKRHFESLWTFVREEGVEPTNNEAERTVRPAVIWRRTSFGSSGKDGSGHRFVERILTCVATLKRQGIEVAGYLQRLFESVASGRPAPSLLLP